MRKYNSSAVLSCPLLSPPQRFFFHVSVCPWELAAPSKPIMVIIVLWPKRLAAKTLHSLKPKEVR